MLLAMTLAGLAFLLSPPFGVVAVAFVLMGSALYSDYQRRMKWEAAAAFRIQTLDHKTGTLANDVQNISQQQNSAAKQLENLKNRIDISLDAPSGKRQPDSKMLDDAPLISGSHKYQDFTRSAKTETPRAVKPGTPFFGEDEDEPSSFASFGNAEDDDKPVFSKSLVQSLIQNALKNRRVDVFVQPIMRLPQRKIRFYEVFARIRAGAGLYLQAHEYMELARDSETMADIDTLLLMESLTIIQRSAHIERAAPFFLNVTTETLSNGPFMKRLLNFLSQNRDLAPRLVFEMQQRDFQNLKPALLEIMRGISRLGCAFAMDNTHHFEFDIRLLQVLNVRFIKIPAQALLKSLQSDSDFVALRRIKSQLESNGIGVIGEKIENEAMMKKLLEYDLNYGQGFLFGKPDLQGAYKERKSA